MKNLYIDFDGVILDTITNSVQMMKDINLDIKNNEIVRDFYAKLDWKKLLEDSIIINDGISAIEKIMASSSYKVSILTHVNSLKEAEEKVHYIRKYFKDITIIPVPRSISKTKMVETKDAILIDDYHVNLEEWGEEGGIPILFSTKLAEKGFRVIDKLDQILDLSI